MTSYYERFNNTSSSPTMSGPTLSSSPPHASFSFPDLDSGRIISSNPPHTSSAPAQAPGSAAALPDFPEFASFETSNPILAQPFNLFSSTNGASNHNAANGGSLDVARLEEAAAAVERTPLEGFVSAQGSGDGGAGSVYASPQAFVHGLDSPAMPSSAALPQPPAQLDSSNNEQVPWSSSSAYSQPPVSSAEQAVKPSALPAQKQKRLSQDRSAHHPTKDASDPKRVEEALNRMDLKARSVRPPESGYYVSPPRALAGGEEAQVEKDTRPARPSSFFGMSGPVATIDAAGVERPVAADEPSTKEARRSSFFGADAILAAGQQGIPTSGPSNEPSQAARIAAYHRGQDMRASQAPAGSRSENSPSPNLGPSRSPNGGNGATSRPVSMAPTLGGVPLLEQSHLRPGQQAGQLSHNKALELYRQNAKKTNDPDLIYEFAVFLIDASKSMDDDTKSSSVPSGVVDPNSKDELVREAISLLKRIAERGHPDAQYFLADCYANGIGTGGSHGSSSGKQDFDRAYPLFVLAAKHNHADAAYRAGTCQEKGWGCRKESSKALQFYRKAASQSHPGAMYRLATAELNGELGLKKSAREGVKWLKRSAEAATAEFPHALHELALLHERGVDNLIFVDPEYACELLAQAAEIGYAPSAYKLGVNYEYGRMGCPQDGGLSIHMYNIAAQQNHKEACFALTAWYLVGAPGILPQSDTEAYLWAKKAAEQGLAKAEYAVGYFTESGIGCVKDIQEAKAWYRKAAEHGDRRANQRISALQGRPIPASRPTPGTRNSVTSPNGRHSVVPLPAGQNNGNGSAAYEQGRAAMGARRAAPYPSYEAGAGANPNRQSSIPGGAVAVRRQPQRQSTASSANSSSSGRGGGGSPNGATSPGRNAARMSTMPGPHPGMYTGGAAGLQPPSRQNTAERPFSAYDAAGGGVRRGGNIPSTLSTYGPPPGMSSASGYTSPTGGSNGAHYPSYSAQQSASASASASATSPVGGGGRRVSRSSANAYAPSAFGQTEAQLNQHGRRMSPAPGQTPYRGPTSPPPKTQPTTYAREGSVGKKAGNKWFK